jgi:hypothetical protein
LIVEVRSHEPLIPPPPPDRPVTICMTADQIAAHNVLHLAEDVARLRGRIAQMADLGPGSTIRLRDGRSFPVPADPTARGQLAAMVILIETGNFLGALGLEAKGRRLLSQLAMALADHPRGAANPLLAIASRTGDDGNTGRHRAPDRLDEDLAVGTAAAAIYRRGLAGQPHRAAAEIAAVLDRIGLHTPSNKRRGRDDAGTPDPDKRRWTGPRLLGLFYQVQKHCNAAEKGEVRNAASRRARFFTIALRETAHIADHAQAATVIESEIVKLGAETL